MALLSREDAWLQSVSLSVLCNISEQSAVRHALVAAQIAPALVRMLSSAQDEVRSRAAIVTADVANVDGFQSGERNFSLTMYQP